MKIIKLLAISAVILSFASCGDSEKDKSEAGDDGNHDPKMVEFANIDCERISKANASKANPSDENLAKEVEQINDEMMRMAEELKEELGNEAFNQLLLDSREYNKKNCD